MEELLLESAEEPLRGRVGADAELKNVIRLVLEDTDEAKETLRRRHRAHRLQDGEWERVVECHIGNAGDWLAVWIREDDTAWILRTGTLEEIFGN